MTSTPATKPQWSRYLTFILVLGLTAISCSLPRRPEYSIRERILRDTPQGSSYSTVLNYVKRHGWSVEEHSVGYEIHRFGNVPARVVGKRTINAYLGGYRDLPWYVDVDCNWAFDQNDTLIDVFVDKQVDAP